jgi:hypothetical protein
VNFQHLLRPYGETHYTGQQQVADGSTITYVNNLNAGLTQVLEDGMYAYLYGAGRLAQTSGVVTDYFLGDALGSVRKLVNESGAVRKARKYDLYGNMTGSWESGRLFVQIND